MDLPVLMILIQSTFPESPLIYLEPVIFILLIHKISAERLL